MLDHILEDKKAFYLGFILIAILYFINMGETQIWNSHEAWYAEASREILESGNILDIYYNYELRFNKPPLTYWLMSLSAFIFGLNEFSLRLPIVLLSLGSVLLTYKFGSKLYNRTIGIFSMMIFAVSLQFFSLKSFGSPEVPLTFFFILSLYLFYRAYCSKKNKYIYGFYLALGLTVLTKGFPYYIIIGLIIITYIAIDKRFRVKEVWHEIVQIKPLIGIPIALVIGMTWPIYSYLKFEEQFLAVLNAETLNRALEHDKFKIIKDIFFFPNVILWSVFPFSLVFYYGLINSFKHKKWLKELSLPASWFLIMLIIFTSSEGKLPVYILQSHTAISLIVGYYLFKYQKNKVLWRIFLILPFIITFLLTGALIFYFNFSLLNIIFLIVQILILVYLMFFINLKYNTKYWLINVLIVYVFYLFFAITIVPWMEKYRPFDEIGNVINSADIPKEAPLVVEDIFLFSLPYYAERKVLAKEGDYQINDIKNYIENNNDNIILLIEKENRDLFPNKEVLWKGIINKRNEAHLFKYMRVIRDIELGKDERFGKRYVLLY